ncbi:unnamed protein product [Phytophthora lilii]|uniref:Unnamed protein product n=1 Tax=Phytophthora lilii TaxID=2077276 RepID=A0A9W6U2X4_9STRA|nr:unnamed protein product [Phytophthora lilii]
MRVHLKIKGNTDRRKTCAAVQLGNQECDSEIGSIYIHFSYCDQRANSDVKPRAAVTMAEAALIEELSSLLGVNSYRGSSPQEKAAGGDRYSVNFDAINASCFNNGEFMLTRTTVETSTNTSGDSCQNQNLHHRSRREKESCRKRLYHQRLKKERENLRRSVHELSLQLQDLKQSRAFNEHPINESIRKTNAILQRMELKKSENEQLQLLAAVEKRAADIKKICTLVTGAPCITMDQRATVLLRDRNDPPFDISMYRGHVRRVFESYSVVDGVIQEFRTVPEGIFNTVQRRESDGEVQYFQHLNKFIQPFCFEQTQTALWKLSSLQHRQLDRNDYKGLVDPNDAIVLRFRLIQTLSTGMVASVLQRYVIHRFQECSRTVLVWKMHTEGEGLFSGMHSDGTGWVCLEHATNEDSTRILACIRHVPMAFSISKPGHQLFSDFQLLLQNSVNEDMMEVTSALDKLLLEDTLKGIDL